MHSRERSGAAGVNHCCGGGGLTCELADGLPLDECHQTKPKQLFWLTIGSALPNFLFKLGASVHRNWN